MLRSGSAAKEPPLRLTPHPGQEREGGMLFQIFARKCEPLDQFFVAGMIEGASHGERLPS